MKFKKMELNNFRQFKDNVEIEFSTDSDKNVTVLIGDNGAGKTTLLQAFNWCLYDKLSGLENPTELLNNDTLSKMEIGDICDVDVLIEFEHCNRTYTCKNYKKYQKISSNSSKCIESNQTFTKTELDGQTYKIEQKEINDIFPKDLSVYFLFDGERLVQLGENKTKGKKDLSSAVKNLLGLDVLKNANDHLLKAKKSFENEYVSDNTKRLDEIRYLLDQADEEIEKEKKNISKSESENENIETRLEELNQILKTFEKLKDLQEKRNEYNIQKAQNTRDIEECKKSIFLNFGSYMPTFFLNNTIKELQYKLQHTKLNDKSIQGIHGIAVQEILERGRCICGCDINVNNEARKNLEDLMDYILPNDYSASLKGLESSLKHINNTNSDFYDRFEELYRNYNKLLERKVNIENIINDNENKIANIGDKDLNKYNDEYLKLQSEYNRNNQAIGRSKGIILAKQNEQQKLANERSRLAISNNINDEIRKRVEICDVLISEISKRLGKKETEVKEKMQHHASILLSKMLHSNKIIEIDSDYTFSVYDEFGNPVLSEGERIVVSFAFVSALIKVAKEILIYKDNDVEMNELDKNEEDKVFTLVMDAPFAKLDIDNSEGVSTVIPYLTDQIILFTVNKQWEGKIKECLISKVGVMYQMEKDKDISGITKINKVEE